MERSGRISAIIRVPMVIALLLGALMAQPARAGVGQASTHAFDPDDFGGPIDNPWFPLTPGTTLVYKGTKDGKQATDIFQITHRTRMIQGVRCVVVLDTLTLNGRIAERTRDWYAQDRRGNVWYLGERTAEYDARGNVVSREGSWQSGVDGANAGIFMPAHPYVGQTGVQEDYPGHAEDHFRILSLTASVTVPYGSFDHALKTREWTPLEPDVRDAKYYVRGIGEVKEKAVRGPREILKLVQVIRPEG